MFGEYFDSEMVVYFNVIGEFYLYICDLALKTHIIYALNFKTLS